MDNSQMGRINISNVDGDTDGDGDIDVLHSYGSRGFTIFNAETGEVVFDSGSEFARIVADANPGGFNDDDGDSGEDRSDNKGVEPEALTFGQIGEKTIAFIGLERDGGIMAYDVTNPAEATFLTYFSGRPDGDISPEGFTFVSASESTTGQPQLIAAYEVSGTTIAYDLGGLPLGGGTQEVGEDGVSGPIGIYENTSFTGVGDGDMFVFTNLATPFTTRDIMVDPATGGVTIQGTSFDTDADFETSNFLAAKTSDSETTAVLVDELLGDGSDLLEGQSVDPTQVDGIVFREFLTGDGMIDYRVTVDQSTSASANALGAFEFDVATNTASNVQILFSNMGAATGQTATVNDVADGAELVFFLMQNGAAVAEGLTGTLGFDFSGALPVMTENGTAVTAEIFHSAGAAFNSDGIEHFLSGVIDGGGQMRVGIDDHTGGGDLDYQAAVFPPAPLDDLGHSP